MSLDSYFPRVYVWKSIIGNTISIYVYDTLAFKGTFMVQYLTLLLFIKILASCKLRRKGWWELDSFPSLNAR